MENIINSQQQNLPKVLIIKPPPVFILYESEFCRHFQFLKAYESDLPLSDFLDAANSAGVTAMITGPGVSVTKTEILDRLPSLGCIVTPSAGVNHIDMDQCRRRNISVVSAGDAYSDDCADLTVGLLIDVLRKLSSADGFVRRGGWSNSGQYPLGNKVLRWWGISGVLQNNAIQCSLAWNRLSTKRGANKIWSLIFGCVVWSLWFERNRIKFDHGVLNANDLFYKVKIRVGIWAKELLGQDLLSSNAISSLPF